MAARGRAAWPPRWAATPSRRRAPPVYANATAAPFTDLRARAGRAPAAAGALARDAARPARRGRERFVELGPGAVLTGLVKRTLRPLIPRAERSARRQSAPRAARCALRHRRRRSPPERGHQRRPAQGLETSDEWIVRRTGIRERRRLDGDETLTDLAAAACTAALADAGRDASEVDHVIVSTFTPDKLTPGLAPEVAAPIGAARRRPPSTSTPPARASSTRSTRPRRSSRPGARASCSSAARRPCRVDRRRRPRDRRPVRRRRGRGGRGRRRATAACAHFVLGSDGEQPPALRRRDERVLRMRGPEVYRHAVARMVEATREALRRAPA